MEIVIRNEDEIIDISQECPRCASIAWGYDEAWTPLAMPLNRARTAHLCYACGLLFGTPNRSNSEQ